MSAIEYEIRNPSELRNAEEAVRMADLENMRPLPRISVHAFCESEALQHVMERCANDRRVAKVSMRITSGGIAAAANMFSGAPTPNLIILETKANAANLLGELAPLAAVCDPTTKVVIIGYYNDIGLYRELIRNGISEYMVQPVAMPDILTAMASIFVDPDAEPLGRSIAFIGSKGGTGASTIAHNCAFGISISSPPRRSSPISTCPLARRTSTSIRIRPRASPKRSSHPIVSTRSSSTAC